MEDMEPKTYRKTALIQAMYWDVENGDATIEALGEWGAKTRLSEDGCVWHIQTLEGWLPMHAQGYVCRNPKGHFYQQTRTEFEENYEEVTPPAAE